MADPTPEEICARVYARMCNHYQVDLGELICKHDRRRDHGLQFIEQLIYSTGNGDDVLTWSTMGTTLQRRMGHAINVLFRECRPVDPTADVILAWIVENGPTVLALHHRNIADLHHAKRENFARRWPQENVTAPPAASPAEKPSPRPVRPAVGSLLPTMPLPPHLARRS